VAGALPEESLFALPEAVVSPEEAVAHGSEPASLPDGLTLAKVESPSKFCESYCLLLQRFFLSINHTATETVRNVHIQQRNFSTGWKKHSMGVELLTNAKIRLV
jgi:hypothetical protein